MDNAKRSSALLKSPDFDSNGWNEELIGVLEKIRLNSIHLSEKHRTRFLEYKSLSKYFDLPVIICSVFSSSFGSISAVPTNKRQLISTTISMFIAVLTSIKLYLNLSSTINDEVLLSKEFYILSVSIYKVLNLKPTDRSVKPLQFLNDCYSHYIKLIQQSSILRKSIKQDELTKLSIGKYMSEDGSSSGSSSGSLTPKNLLHTSSDDGLVIDIGEL